MLSDGYFVDIKTTKAAIDDTVWTEFGRVRWFEAQLYIADGSLQDDGEAVYKKPFEPIIYAVTKATCDTRYPYSNLDAMQRRIRR